MELQKIYKDTDFSNAEIPEDQILTYIGTDENGKVVTRYKDNQGNVGTISGSGGGGSNGCDYYKCASVDTTAKTWTGYKAEYSEDGGYSFSDVPSPLTYGAGYTPAPDVIYDAGATVRVTSLFTTSLMGDIFSADLLTDAGATVPLSTSNNINFGKKAGRDCAILEGESCLFNKDIRIAPPFSVSFSAYWESGPLVGFGVFSPLKGFEIHMDSAEPSIYNMGHDPESLYTSVNIQNRWAHIVCTFDGSERAIYVDKNKEAIGELNGTTAFTGLVIGSFFGGDNNSFRDGYMVGGLRFVKVFNRILSQTEINDLYEEQA